MADEPSTPRDVIVVMVDDMAPLDGRVIDRLPNIRTVFAEGGLRFDAAYSETPLCCPGRAAFLTGQHTRRHKVTKNDARLLDPTETIATTLDGAGYQTALIGKYLNWAQLLEDPTPDGWDYVSMLISSPSVTSSNWLVEGVPTARGHADRAVLDETTAWLAGTDRRSPVFLWASPKAPHWGFSEKTPWLPHVEPRFVGDPRCSNIPPWAPPSYDYAKQPAGFPLDEICRSLLTVDEMVGALRDVAERQGRDPIWVFTADNGMAWGEHGFPIKNNPWAVRLPLYVAGRGVASGSISALVSGIDVGPTIAELGGTTMPNADGVSFLHLFDGEGDGRSWMLEDHPLGGFTAGPWRGGWWGVRTPRWHLVKRIGTIRPALYDLRADPWELKDVRTRHRSTVKRLRALAAPLLTPLE